MAGLWAVGTNGSVFLLDPKIKHWNEVVSIEEGLEGVKRVAATADGWMFAVGCNYQLYLYIPATSNAIMQETEIYEHERWAPMNGWSSAHLLPMDPPVWSLNYKEILRENIKLESPNWNWQEQWMIDESFGGHMTCDGGWQYGTVDFRKKFCHSKTFRSCIRRRRWIRVQEYAKRNVWAAMPGLSADPLEEPIADVAVGYSSQQAATIAGLCVWVLSVDGSIYLRSGIAACRPEGISWTNVPCDEEIMCFAAGTEASLWVYSCEKKLFRRLEISLKCPTGSSWQEIDVPMSDRHIISLAVGPDAVWIVDSVNSVLFRKGVSVSSGGTGWVAMPKKFSELSISGNGQVFGIDSDSKQIWWREGISQTELSGQDWKPLNLPASYIEWTSLSSKEESNSCPLSSSPCDSFSDSEMEFTRSLDAITRPTLILDGIDKTKQLASKIQYEVSTNTPLDLYQVEQKIASIYSKSHLHSLVRRVHQFSSVGDARVAFKNQKTSISFVKEGLDSVVSRGRIRKDRLPHDEGHYCSRLDDPPAWSSLSAGPLLPEVLPNICNHSPAHRSSTWKNRISENLQVRNAEIASFLLQHASYTSPHTESGWQKTAKLRWYHDDCHFPKWIDCRVTLTADTSVENSFLFIEYEHRQQLRYKDVCCTDISCVESCGLQDGSHYVLHLHLVSRVHCGRSIPTFLRFASASELEILSWLVLLTSICAQPMLHSGYWLIGENGSCFVGHSDPSQHFLSFRWSFVAGHMKVISGSPSRAVWALGFDGSAYILRDASEKNKQQDEDVLSVHENQRWRPVIGFTSRTSILDSHAWTTLDGQATQKKEFIKLPSNHWTWSGNWQLACDLDTDDDGWMYAKSFSSTFQSQSFPRSHVRRRCWSRPYIIHWVGPWVKVNSQKLLQVCVVGTRVWALDMTGQVLFREGITSLMPQGVEWRPIVSDLHFCCVTAVDGGGVWALARDGSIWLRGGISADLPHGQYWFHIAPPEKLQCRLVAISACDFSLLATDESGMLWNREGCSLKCPEGLKWDFLEHRIVAATFTSHGKILAIRQLPHGQFLSLGKVSKGQPKWKNLLRGNYKFISSFI